MQDPHEVHITISPGGSATIAAYCLTTDLWDDYKTHIVEAENHASQKNYRLANRSLRSAIHALFSHTEGVMNRICVRKKYTDAFDLSFKGKQQVIDQRARAASNTASGSPDLEYWKKMRDVLTHPGIVKSHGDSPITFADLYAEENLINVKELGAEISTWLDFVCSTLKVTRMIDTGSLCHGFAAVLGPTTEAYEV